MDSKPLRPQHPSYRTHRRQTAWQIIVPVVLAGLLVLGTAVLVGSATFRGNGDVSRWAAISTIWLVIPVMFVSLLILIALIAFAYLLGRLAGLIPPYTFQAQQFAYRVEAGARRIEYIGRKPFSVVPELGKLVKTILTNAIGLVRERITGQH